MPPVNGRTEGADGYPRGVSSPRPTPELVVYTAEGCCLCDDARATLDRLIPELDLDVRWVHIDGNDALEDEWRTQIPAGVLNGRKVFKFRVDEPLLRRRVASLARAADPEGGPDDE